MIFRERGITHIEWVTLRTQAEELKEIRLELERPHDWAFTAQAAIRFLGVDPDSGSQTRRYRQTQYGGGDTAK